MFRAVADMGMDMGTHEILSQRFPIVNSQAGQIVQWGMRKVTRYGIQASEKKAIKVSARGYCH